MVYICYIPNELLALLELLAKTFVVSINTFLGKRTYHPKIHLGGMTVARVCL